jgi:hypothetical protein
MQRSLITIVAAVFAGAMASASAQDSGLAGVTMRVLDDVSDIDAVVLELDANRGEDEGDAQSDAPDEPDRDAAEPAEIEDRFDERPDPEDLHDPDDDEDAEGKLEDNDIEQPAAAPVP